MQRLLAYERLVAYAAANMKVVTSEDIVKMAQAAKDGQQTKLGPEVPAAWF